MARQNKKKTAPVSIESVLRGMIHDMLEARLAKTVGDRDALAELRDLKTAVARLEKRLDTLAERAGVRRRRSKSARGPGRPAIYEKCTVRGCDEDHYAKGMCSKHYQRDRRRQEG
ncbi:MAG: hypothetical protein Q9Q40_15200 [Acidobacteriota bacterium]|nr:hypothetical protein [Acidobacteriota bacterium]MDQ7088929.1 hypothetical protein [Acidobacteriota bacterium]